ncbi:MAG: PQQ-binding-like beta-propeller repeat protein [Desulfobacterales bacterium]|jgi:hypothetical protein|nr:PQQ-binding-like beta-propeller repeat protein [Desulfobacterales bacterium]
MKNKILISIVLFMLACHTHRALAAEMNFSAGSLIIPMDSYYQPDTDGGILEAYGLVFYLLKHETDGEHDITVYWIINQEKTTIDGTDFVIEDLTEDDAITKLYDHDGTTSELTFNTGDNYQKITYSSAPFIIDGIDSETAREIIKQSNWAAVEVHEAQVPFAAPVYREMHGTPPKIALMNNSETHEGGNAAILESYLRLAGICTDVYDVVTPNEIRDGILTSGDGYDFLWSPHWTGYDGYTADNNTNGKPDVEDIVIKVQEYLKDGRGLLAECASIEVFEHSPNGLFLTTKGFGHNGGSGDSATIIYNNVTMPNPQAGDFDFMPEGGHLHNWRPYQSEDAYNFSVEPDVSGGNSEYHDTVSRFTIDNTGWDYYVGGYAYGDTNNGYVVYLGGHKYASCGGGGKGTETNPDPDVHFMELEFAKDIKTDSNKENFTLLVEYDSGSETRITFTASDIDDFSTLSVSTVDLDSYRYQWTLSPADASTCSREYYLEQAGGGDPMISEPSNVIEGGLYMDRKTGMVGLIDKNEWAWGDNDSLGFDTIYVELNSHDDPDGKYMKAEFPIKTGDPLQVDLSTASMDKKKIKDVTLSNIGSSAITVDAMTFYWIGGDSDQKFKKIIDMDTDVKVYDRPELTSGTKPAVDKFTTFTIDAAVADAVDDAAGCTNNNDCSWKSIAGVRYILNTLFNIRFQISSHEYVRSAPIVSHPYLYQGSFEYPSWEGHFRRFDLTSGDFDSDNADWDTADGGIPDADSRSIYTAGENEDGSWSKIDFTTGNIAAILRYPLDVTPDNEDDTDEHAVIERLRGKDWDPDTSAWIERSNRLGAIEHSAPVIVDTSSRSGDRAEMAYVGDMNGMLHAIETATGNEKWAYIPGNLLGKLKNNRTDENAPQDFAALDGSPTALDVYYDPPNIDGTARKWRTILVCPQGFGGKYIFALDITDPDDWDVLWEKTDTEAPGGGMGHAYRASIQKVKWPVKDESGEISGHTAKYVVFVATGFASIAEAHGGINVFAYDLRTGDKLWHFSQGYEDSVNDIPGAITSFSTKSYDFVDRIYVGDMSGRMWELDAVTGVNPHGTDGGKEIPLWNAGVGNPISVSPVVTRINPVVVTFGTGGADWAADDENYYIYAVNATDTQESPSYSGGAGTLVWEYELPPGEKVWSTPTVSEGELFIATSTGSMERADPRQDIASGTGKLRVFNLKDGIISGDGIDVGKTRGSIYINRGQISLTTIDNITTHIGDGDYSTGNITDVVLKAWRHLK